MWQLQVISKNFATHLAKKFDLQIKGEAWFLLQKQVMFLPLISATFLPVLDYGDVLYMCSLTSCLQSLTPVYHCALRFITGWSRLTHHCELYDKAGMPSLNGRRYTHWTTLVYKALIGLVPTYSSTFLQRTESRYALWSNYILHFSAPFPSSDPEVLNLKYVELHPIWHCSKVVSCVYML